MSCEKVREELVALLDGELDRETTAQVKGHLESCEGCAGEHREFAQAQGLLGDALVAESPAGPRFDELWAAADGVGGARLRESELRPASRSRGGSGAGRRGLVSVALAAAAAAALFFYQLIPSAPPTTAPVVAVAETAPPVLPAELVDNPDMFVDFVIVRRLEKLRQLPALLDSPGAEGHAEEVGHT